MRATAALLLLAAAAVEALSGGFLGRKAAGAGWAVAGGTRAHSLRMDSERLERQIRVDLDRIIQETARPRRTPDQAEAVHGMPWTTSIDPGAFAGEELLYMPFWKWQMSFMKEHLTDLKVVSCHDGKTDFGYNENAQKKARIVNLCFSSREYRKIRLTYYDAGDNCQVFNAVFYPDPAYNLPVLGADLLAFNRKKYLAIVDFQPLHAEESHHARGFEHILAPIKAKYDALKGQMSSKFYDETQFFSQQMLFSRFEEEAVVADQLFPAYTEYVRAHLDLIRGTPADPAGAAQVLARQTAYDTYSAERDPAAGLFCAMFGNDWAQDYMHNFLFSRSERKEGAATAPPAMSFMGGPPQGAPQGARKAAVAQR